MNWIYQGQEIISLEQIEEILGYQPYGFLYNIVAENGKEYIGQKQLCSTRSKIVGKRQLQKEGKSNFRKRRNKKTKEWTYYEEVVKESNWKEYVGSNEELKKDIAKGAKYTKYILKFVKKKSMMLYEETKAILCTGALEDERFYNGHVLNKFFKRNIMKNNGES